MSTIEDSQHLLKACIIIFNRKIQLRSYDEVLLNVCYIIRSLHWNQNLSSKCLNAFTQSGYTVYDNIVNMKLKCGNILTSQQRTIMCMLCSQYTKRYTDNGIKEAMKRGMLSLLERRYKGVCNYVISTLLDIFNKKNL